MDAVFSRLDDRAIEPSICVVCVKDLAVYRAFVFIFADLMLKPYLRIVRVVIVVQKMRLCTQNHFTNVRLH